MLLPWRRRRNPLEEGWQRVAERLDLEPAPESRALLADLLDLQDEADMGPVHRVGQTGDLDVWVLCHRGQIDPRTRERLWATACLLTSEVSFATTSWRASRRLHHVLASLQASAAGGQLLEFPDDPAFSEALTVVARDVPGTRAQLSRPVRAVLERAVGRYEETLGLTVGEGRILMSLAGPEVRFDAVEHLVTDVMSLYAALRGG